MSLLGSGTVSVFVFEKSAGKHVTHLLPTFWTGWKTFITVKRFQLFSLTRWVVHHTIKRRGLRYYVPKLVLDFHILNLAEQSLRPSSKHDW
jgi:hypothetical protein